MIGGGAVPVARRQLLADPAKLIVALVAVAAAVALVLLLSGLRRGMGEQATIYLDHQPPAPPTVASSTRGSIPTSSPLYPLEVY